MNWVNWLLFSWLASWVISRMNWIKEKCLLRSLSANFRNMRWAIKINSCYWTGLKKQPITWQKTNTDEKKRSYLNHTHCSSNCYSIDSCPPAKSWKGQSERHHGKQHGIWFGGSAVEKFMLQLSLQSNWLPLVFVCCTGFMAGCQRC